MKIKLSFCLLLILFLSLAKAATPPSATIFYSPFCSTATSQPVTLIGTAGGTFSASPSGLFINSSTGTINPSLSLVGTYVVSYTIPASGQDPAFTTSTTVTIGTYATPTFSLQTHYCPGSTIAPLPLVSDNAIMGTWSPAVVSNQTTTTYTFVPNVGQCAVTTTVTIYIGDVQPDFAFNGNSFCLDALPVLPTTSFNGITGSWSPSVVTVSGPYTFTPDAGQCATSVTENFTVNPLPTASISGSTTICQGQSSVIVFTGTPGAVVTYNFDNNAMQTIVLDPSGSAVMALPVLSVGLHTVCLRSVNSGGMQGCTANLTDCSIINVTPSVVVPPIPDITVCESYTLPPLQTGNYYLLPGGNGPMLQPGEVITASTVLYVYASNSCGSDEESFVVTVVPSSVPVIATENNADYIYVDGNDVAQGLLLNATMPTGNYSYQWTLFGNDILGANGPTYLVNTTVQGGTHSYTVRVTNLITGCIAESTAFEVHETPVPAPVGDPNQTFTLGQTLADVVVYGQNIQWYDSLNRGTDSTPLPLNTVLQEGVTYYATQTINGHESPSAYSITIHFLANNTFSFKDLKFAPNPVRGILQVSSKDMIQKVMVLNLMGQKVLQQNVNTLDFSLPMSQLKTGNYFVKLESGNKSQVIKVIKE